jgi:hypothetical protein
MHATTRRILQAKKVHIRVRRVLSKWVGIGVGITKVSGREGVYGSLRGGCVEVVLLSSSAPQS